MLSYDPSYDPTTIPCDVPKPTPATHRRPSRWRMALEVFSTLMTVLIAAVAGLTIVLAIASHLSSTGQYTVFGHPVMTVLSGSMSPTIRTGDLIVDASVTPQRVRNLRPGQIISFREEPGSTVIITHRIVRRIVKHHTVTYFTRGDANNAPDALYRPAKDVVGVFQHSIRDGGYVLNALHKPLALGLLFASVILFFVAGPLFRMARKIDRQRADADRRQAQA